MGGTLIAHKEGYVVIRVGRSRLEGKLRRVSVHNEASIGRMGGHRHAKARLGKAGRSRRRPHVRGEAINPVDHPHGGRTRGGRPELTPWSRRAKGVPTVRKYRHAQT